MNDQSSLFKEISADEISLTFSEYLGEEIIHSSKLLDGGMFNTTYYVAYGVSHKQAVLRLGPVNRHLLMGFEENLMEAEVYVCDTCHKLEIPCSEVLAYDTSKRVIDRDLMIVKYIPSVVMLKAGLSQSEKDRLYGRIGRYLCQLHQTEGKSFGFVSRILAGQCFDTWSEALCYEVDDILSRLEKRGGLTGEEASAVRKMYDDNRKLLDEIKIPHLLHTDLWEGNVLLDEQTHDIAAIIDGDRAVFGDIDFEFSSPWMENPQILEGYGMNSRNVMDWGRQKRRELYLLFYTLIETYVGYAEYNNPEQYRVHKQKIMDMTGKRS